MNSSACYHLTSCTVACLAIRHLIRHRLYNSQSTISTSRFIRLLILCVVAGGVPFLAHLLSYLVPLQTSRMPSWPWSAVHKNFRTIPSLPYSHQTPEQRRAFVTDVWVHIITGTLCFCIWVATDDVREDLSKAWSLCTRRICGLHGLHHADSPSPSPPSLDSPIAESRPAFSAPRDIPPSSARSADIVLIAALSCGNMTQYGLATVREQGGARATQESIIADEK